MQHNLSELYQLYEDAPQCAAAARLSYVGDDTPGFTRVGAGSGFSYKDDRGDTVTNRDLRTRLEKLAIPPAWQEVWICADADGHIQATGKDEAGRKQYIYHQKWREVRDLLNFYRMILFAHDLGRIRGAVDYQLRRQEIDKAHVMAAMVWLLDRTLMRIGSDQYFAANATVGLTTLTKDNVDVEGNRITFRYKAKSGKEREVDIATKRIAHVINRLMKIGDDRLFVDPATDTAITADAINSFMDQHSDYPTSAKDFRTWGGTVAAFVYLRDHRDGDSGEQERKHEVVEAVDEAAESLGNTRAVARSSYIHPHILEAYAEDKFTDFLAKTDPKRNHPRLSANESQTLQFLEVLFAERFDLGKIQSKG